MLDVCCELLARRLTTKLIVADVMRVESYMLQPFFGPTQPYTTNLTFDAGSTEVEVSDRNSRAAADLLWRATEFLRRVADLLRQAAEWRHKP